MMVSAQRRLMAMISSGLGTLRGGARALFGNRAARTARSRFGMCEGRRSVVRMWWDRSLVQYKTWLVILSR